MTRFLQVTLILAAAVSTAVAQTEREIGIEVEVNGDCAVSRKAISIVLDGNETNWIPLSPTDASAHLWKGSWRDRRPAKFPAASLSASLRLEAGRTYCQYASAKKDEQDAVVASFTFQCDEQPVLDVSIATKPPIAVSYVRRLPRSGAADHGPRPSPCIEEGTLRDGDGTVRKIRFPIEGFRLQLGAETATVDQPGLLVLDAEGKDARAPVRTTVDPSLRRNSRDCDGKLCLHRDDLVKTLREQSARGLANVPPLFLPNAYDLDLINLGRSKLNDLSLAVK